MDTYQKKYRRMVAGILCILLVLIGCNTHGGKTSGLDAEEVDKSDGASANDTPRPTTLDSLAGVLDLANNMHRAYQKPRVELTDYIVTASDGDFNIFDYTLDMSQSYSYDSEIPMTLEDAQEDVEVLFAALKNNYGPYLFFGGDEVFDAAKEEILAGCKELEEAGELVSLQFTYLVHGSLTDIIDDGHFTVNGVNFRQVKVPYLYSQAVFDRTDNGYLSRNGLKLESVDGWPDLDALMRLTITDSGEVAYCPIVLREVDYDMTLPEDITLCYADGSSETVSPDPWEGWYEDDDRSVDLTYNDGIPVLFVRNMGYDQAQEDIYHGQEFLDYAEALKDEPVVVLDLRSNTGGNAALPLKWLSIWSGEPVTTNSVGLQYLSHQDILDFVERTENYTYNSYEDFTEVLSMEPVSDEYMSFADVPDIFVENDKVLIVLTGKYTSSAAETFADAAKNVENVLLVGENTYGMVISNAYVSIALPNSGTMIQMGCNLMFYPEEVEEYSGILPDIWVNGDAEESVVRMLQNFL